LTDIVVGGAVFDRKISIFMLLSNRPRQLPNTVSVEVTER
jgi:hypothetical protein